MSSFRCCRNKESTVYFCIVCYSTVHRSCWARANKQFTAIKDNLIICSPNCLEISIERDPDTFDILHAQVDNLLQETKEKDAHIERIKRNSMSMMEDATRNEEEYIQELADSRKKIKSLEDQISNQKKYYSLGKREVVTQAIQVEPPTKNSSCQSSTLIFKSNHTQTETIAAMINEYETDHTDGSSYRCKIYRSSELHQQIELLKVEVQEKEAEIQELMRELKEISVFNDKYKVTISTLEAENNSLSCELKELKNKLTEDSSTNPNMASSEVHSNFSWVRQEISSIKEVIAKHFYTDFRLTPAAQTSALPMARINLSSTLHTHEIPVADSKTCKPPKKKPGNIPHMNHQSGPSFKTCETRVFSNSDLNHELNMDPLSNGQVLQKKPNFLDNRPGSQFKKKVFKTRIVTNSNYLRQIKSMIHIN